VNLKHPSQRKPISVRIDTTLWRDVRAFVHDEAGSPLFQKTGAFVEAALRAHLDAMRPRAAEARRS